MSPAVVHVTKGKLDLRSLSTFGLNSKPNTTNPIGYFGTGMKYAIAVLLRKHVSIEMYIDGRRWTFEVIPSDFRGKKVEEIFLVRHKKVLPSSRIKLPFTTELGKNWQLWQAFRELHSNTLDEKGVTTVDDPSSVMYKPNHTVIIVYGQEYVDEYLARDKTFLPEGLKQRDGSESIQVFDAPSAHVYYRGIRILDLKEEERSTLTYNILSPLELTEDRTVKDEWTVRYAIQNYIASSEDKDLIRKAITAPKKSFENRLSYLYTAPSPIFKEVAIEEEESPDIHSDAKELAEASKPKEPMRQSDDWQKDLIKALKENNVSWIYSLVASNRVALTKVLEDSIQSYSSNSIEETFDDTEDAIPY